MDQFLVETEGKPLYYRLFWVQNNTRTLIDESFNFQEIQQKHWELQSSYNEFHKVKI